LTGKLYAKKVISFLKAWEIPFIVVAFTRRAVKCEDEGALYPTSDCNKENTGLSYILQHVMYATKINKGIFHISNEDYDVE